MDLKFLEKILYIFLNTLKSCVDEIETKKNILHIFNSKYNLDNKNIENLPIGFLEIFILMNYLLH